MVHRVMLKLTLWTAGVLGVGLLILAPNDQRISTFLTGVYADGGLLKVWADFTHAPLVLMAWGCVIPVGVMYLMGTIPSWRRRVCARYPRLGSLLTLGLTRWWGVICTVAGISVLGLVIGTKLFFARARPRDMWDFAFTNAFAHGNLSVKGGLDGGSFVSGHTSSVACLSVVPSAMRHSGRGYSTRAVAVAYGVVLTLTFGMALGRVLIAAHWPTDTLCAAVSNFLLAEWMCHYASTAMGTSGKGYSALTILQDRDCTEAPPALSNPDTDTASPLTSATSPTSSLICGTDDAKDGHDTLFRQCGFVTYALLISLGALALAFGGSLGEVVLFGPDYLAYHGYTPSDHSSEMYHIPRVIGLVGSMACAYMAYRLWWVVAPHSLYVSGRSKSQQAGLAR
ncbi:hypothetical protein KIPB_008190 [Kipferlia bialata]|uniref:Phosphatidic acid phosphatase type 2/haloperoxidase domain-containing protein n=1 Tax=Kipferlia bialata TaxID=797122 RepID=A0A9K3CZL2_9EUKA|nr:hypothetical protein KIPB_008190 [Kipferlia bialata]|eukprot:g8190.t1